MARPKGRAAKAKAKSQPAAAAAAASPGKPRQARGTGAVDENYLREAIKKTLRLQFPGWGADLVDSNVVNGKTLRQVLTEERRHWTLKDDVGVNIKLSPAYYEDKRLTYGRKVPKGEELSWNKESPMGAQPLPPKLVKALGMVADNKREIGPLRQYLKDAKALTPKDPWGKKLFLFI